MPAFLDQGTIDVKNAVAAVISHVIVSDDDVAFDPTQTRINPTQGATTFFAAAATKSDVDGTINKKDYAIQVTSDDFGGKFINTLSVAKGSAASDVLTRAVRTFGIGVEPANDTYNLAVRLEHLDSTP